MLFSSTICPFSAGVGRTGVLLSIDSVVAEAKRTKEVDIFGYVSKMRQNRPYMVQTKVEYNVLKFYLFLFLQGYMLQVTYRYELW